MLTSFHMEDMYSLTSLYLYLWEVIISQISLPRLKGPMQTMNNWCPFLLFLFIWVVNGATPVPAHASSSSSSSTAIIGSSTRYFDWKVQYASVTRLCHTKSLVSVNGQFPGPTVYVREGDTIVVNVTNLVPYNITIHWHGIRQLLSAWADGPGYITQCPIQTGRSYVHRFQIVEQRGTLFWHAHVSWLRATVYGAIVIRPKLNVAYPFISPANDFVVTLGEWWNSNPEDVIAEALETGLGYNISDALTINGQPGVLYSCSQQGTVVYNVARGRTYLFRLINAAVNFQLYFAVKNHSLTVVEIDAEYTKSYTTKVVLLAPGQTTNVLLTANQPVGQYYMAASVHSPAPSGNNAVPFPQTPTTALLSYSGSSPSSNSLLDMPQFPSYNDTTFALNFLQSLRGRGSASGFYYMDIPRKVDENLLFTVGYGALPCPPSSPCALGFHLGASINNISFKEPRISLLQAYYNQINGIYDPTFPDVPPFQYNYTGPPPGIFTMAGTKVKVLNYNSGVQMVLQGTSTLLFEAHPVHLHGQNFYIVGSGVGNYDPNKDPQKFNLVDPPSRNTVVVPPGGWVAVRFRANNPGVWYMHCHFDIHNSWGMAMAFIVKNGVGPRRTLPAPPADLPPC